jgi:dipeptidase
MCDTLVAVGEATLDGTVILAKNSDRHPNEAQALTYVPGARHEAGAVVRCTHISIPQVAETHEVLLSRPFWTWGCEMGVNAPGVAIGNEAVFTREPYDKGPGLLGMDMARLALERAGTARRALEVIVELLDTYGQGGNHGLLQKQYYHNSFLIADPQEAWVLETAGKYWAADRVRNVRTISNGLTIGREWELAGPGLREHAVERRWAGAADEVALDRCYSDTVYTSLDGCRTRQRRTTALLEAELGQVTVASAMAALRDHGPRAAGQAWNPAQGLTMDAACAHASLGPLRPSGTAGSMVAHLAPDLVTCWLTGTAAPCTGIFKPVYLGGSGLPDIGPEPGGAYDGGSLWWAHERLHRAVIEDYATRLPLYQADRDALEGAFLREAGAAYERYRQAGSGERAAPLAALTASCFDRARRATADWTARVQAAEVRRRPGRLFSLAWRGWNRAAGLPADIQGGG